METRPYFLLGDLLANVSTGALAGLACAALFDPAWNMWLGMFLGMAIGMAIALVLGVGLFFIFFGAMEVMIPTMLTGMVAGMIVGMAAPMTGMSLLDGIRWGALSGIGCLGFTYVMNALLAGRTANG